MLADKLAVMQQALPLLLQGAWMTIKLTTFGVLIGVVLGTILGLARVWRSNLSRKIAKGYIEFFRGTPLLVQLFLLYYGLPSVGVEMSPYLAATLGLGLNSGAYVGEIVRSGINAINEGQMEAARSLGMSYFEAMRYVILPQAFKRVIPPLGNEFIALLKDSSLVSVIAVKDLTRQGRLIISRTYESFLIYAMVAVLYFIMTFLMTRLVNLIEGRLNASDQG
ncbi:ectoine/hydroxyectoine ABC transporter, permease protein EhuC [Halobacteroides halobius DSM 5150]|uniref:Ectoine/hydroxyectoine ABC transporter, permease protein EhuC n=1 Tax=Halobacteroides halobius (strain ATCC 35273 / DSM 5150 / MD-1) TaxID=748449 RepID=L0KC29_HALHC|nr:ectoine/hydroxyectoine ABC transporter permease subunit EhuC [Halobacteroides halobius]AGB42110.1 ectoine/hydroxyectoine ABC transporter, permease protein EhuC [Halobacteroides halobius DSM 5150]